MGDEFQPEFNDLHLEVRNEILAHSRAYYSNSGRCWDGPALTRWTTHATQI
jgi:hypothetical protein